MMNDANDKITQLEQQLSEMTRQRDQLSQSLSQMSTHFEQLISAQTMALEEARDLALSASKTKSEFLANMSHEIRTPLTAIIGFSNSLADEKLSEQDIELATASIIRNSHHLMNIINDILDLAKIEQQQFELEQIEFDLIELVNEVKESVLTQALEKNLWLNIHLQFPLPQMISCDPTWVKQVLLNLTSNAVKFTQQGGIDIDVAYLPQQQRMLIEVVDSGIGIDHQQQKKIFNPFSQADTTTTRRYGGTGLGLTICTKLAQLMQGDLSVSSEIGKGSRFSFQFAIHPLDDKQLLMDQSQIKLDKSSQARPTTIPNLRGQVLVAEDSIDTQNLVALYIKKTGAQVTFANNGQQAVEMALAENFDMVLMDIQMPLLDGLEATALLRQVGFLKPIIAFTANAEKQELEAAETAGCNGHITKPIDRNVFFDMLSSHLQANDGVIGEDSEDSFLDDEQFHIIRANFIRRSPTFIKELNLALEQANWSHAKILIHTFKGTCGSLGFKQLYTVVKQMEQQVLQNIKLNSDIVIQTTDLQQEINRHLGDQSFARQK